MFASKITSRMSAFPFKTQFQTGISRLLASKYSTEVSVSADQATDDNASQFVLDKLYKKIEVEVRGNDPAVLKSYGQFATMAAKHLGITMTKNMAPKKAIHERFTLLKSVHIYKKHRVQYEIRTYYRFMDFLRLTGSTADTFMEYLQRNLPEGVAMKVTKVELQKLPESVPQATTPS